MHACQQAGYYFPTNVTVFPEYVLGIRVPFDKFASDYVHWLEGGFACSPFLYIVFPLLVVLPIAHVSPFLAMLLHVSLIATRGMGVSHVTFFVLVELISK